MGRRSGTFVQDGLPLVVGLDGVVHVAAAAAFAAEKGSEEGNGGHGTKHGCARER